MVSSREQVDNTGRQTRRLLLIGFGGLLILLAFTGINTLSVLNQIQERNEEIRREYVNRDQILEELRSDIYLSGTYVRDLLLDPIPSHATSHLAELNSARTRIDSLMSSYRKALREEEKAPFNLFREQVESYFASLAPALEWNAEQRKTLGYRFMQESLLPRRLIVVRLADQIGRLNQEQMNAGNGRVVALFTASRTKLSLLVAATLVAGCLLAWGSVRRILRLEHLSQMRLDEASDARRELQDLSARLIEAQETERRALSRELHDEVGQALSALLIALGNAAAMLSPKNNPEISSQLLDTRRLAERTVAVVRDMCLFLRPSMLDDLGLLPALEWQAREISRTSPLRVSVKADASLDDLSDDQKTCVYRVVQEALRNVVRHARAKTAQVRLEDHSETLCFLVQDDGQGFDPKRERGLGLLGMEERVKHLQGSFSVRSEGGQGTTVEIFLPKVNAMNGSKPFDLDKNSIGR